MSLLKNCEIAVCNAAIANASNTDDTSDVLDMQGFDGVMFVTPIEDITNTSVITLAAYDNTANSTTGKTAITGASASYTSAGDDDANSKALVVDVYKPTKRYVMSRLTSATANAAFGPTIAIKYHASNKPTTQGATILASAFALGA